MNFHQSVVKTLAFAVCLVGAYASADVYVDCSFVGEGDGSIERPYKSIRQGCAVAEPGMRVLVRGGEGREYVLESCDDAILMAYTSVRLLGCDQKWEPVKDSSATDAMPFVIVDDKYAEESYGRMSKSKDWPAPFTVSASKCTISGFQVKFGAASYMKNNRGGSGLVLIKGDVLATTVEFCRFEMSGKNDPDALVGQNGVISGVYSNGSASPTARDTVIRGCYFSLGNYNGSNCVFWNLFGQTRFEENFVTRLDTLFASTSQGWNSTFQVVSNLFLNCCNQSDGVKTWLFGNNGRKYPNGGEIAYNRFIRDDYDTVGYYLFQHGSQYNGNWESDVLIHHNTIVGYDIAFESPGAVEDGLVTEKPGTVWQPKIFDNLIFNTGAVISETANAKWSGNLGTSFKSGSVFKGNALRCDNDVIGSATSQTWYVKGANLDGWSTRKVLTADPMFVNVTDPTSSNYYRLKVKDDPWVVDSAWSGDAGEYPKYIGAVAPQVRGFAIRIR